MKIHDEAALGSDLATQLDNLLHIVDHDGRTTLSRLMDAMAGQPAAQDTANPSTGGATAWCEHHEREVTHCHRRCRIHDKPLDRCRTDGHRCYLAHDCVGVPIKVTDPTGEAAITDDIARETLAAAEKAVHTGVTALAEALRLLKPWSPRRPSDLERSTATTAGPDGCQSCARVEITKGIRRWEPPHPRITGPTDVNGRLAEPQILCKWCYEHVGTRGCTPSLAELRDHHAGRKVNCPHKVIDDWTGRPTKAKQKKTKPSKPTKPKTRTERLAAASQRRAERLTKAGSNT